MNKFEKDYLHEHPVYWNYACDENGNVYSMKNGKIKKMKQCNGRGGYLRVSIYKDGKIKPLVHRFVYECINGLIPEGYHVDHLDFNRQNNCIDNLRAIPASENAARVSEEGRKRRVEATKKTNSKAVLQLDKQGNIIAEYPSTMEAERQTGINNAHISACCLGKPHYNSAGGFIWRYA